jgi:hypothetical protein
LTRWNFISQLTYKYNYGKQQLQQQPATKLSLIQTCISTDPIDITPAINTDMYVNAPDLLLLTCVVLMNKTLNIFLPSAATSCQVQHRIHNIQTVREAGGVFTGQLNIYQ